MDIDRIEIGDYGKMIKFMGKVFLHTRFIKVVPKLYDNYPELVKWHRGVKENDKFIGAIATVPVHFHLGDRQVRCCGVGMVSVAKNQRGKGIMGKMLKRSIADAIEDHDADIMVLTGHRQRYEYFGFVPSGVMHIFNVQKNNVEHKKDKSKFTLVSLENNKEYLNDMYELYEKQPYRWHREKERFYDIIRCWDYRTKVILKNGEFVGYCVMHKMLGVSEELVLREDIDVVDAVCGIITETGRGHFCLRIPHYQTKQINALIRFAERYSIEQNCAIKILNYPRLIANFLNDELTRRPLIEGKVTLKIADKLITIEIKGADCIAVEKEYAEEDIYDLELNEMEGVIALCAYNGAFLNHSLLRSWGLCSGGLCPISMPHIDIV